MFPTSYPILKKKKFLLKNFFRRTPNLFPWETNSEFGKQIRSSGNWFGVREINSEFGKLIRSSGNKFGVRETNSEFGENFFFDFSPSYRSNLKKIKTCWVLEMSLFLIFDGKFFWKIRFTIPLSIVINTDTILSYNHGIAKCLYSSFRSVVPDLLYDTVHYYRGSSLFIFTTPMVGTNSLCWVW